MMDAVHIPDWQDMALNPGVLREAGLGDDRLVLWLADEGEEKGPYWQRISTVPHATVVRNEGLCAVVATAIRVRQRIRQRFSALLRWFHRRSEDCDWLLPNGESADQDGKRHTDLLLVWAEDQTQPVDAARILTHWPESTRVQSLGPGLFLLSGVTTLTAASESGTHVSDDSCMEQAAHCLAAARRKGDRAEEASALTDLGLAALDQGDLALATVRFEEALSIARILGDSTREADVLGNLGLAALKGKQPEQARSHLEQALVLIRTLGDRFAEKLALERLATVHASQGDLSAAIRLLNDSLNLAHTLGDRQHEADLLWHLAIRQAESGQRGPALRDGQAAVHLLGTLGKPQARVYAEHLEQYRREVARADRGLLTNGQILSRAARPTPTEAGYLQMAISAGKALVQFVGSGLKVVSHETLQHRLQRCTECSYHTSLRCRICGCFTNVKARLPHEECPVGQWKATISTGFDPDAIGP